MMPQRNSASLLRNPSGGKIRGPWIAHLIGLLFVMAPLTNQQVRALKARAQKLKPTLKVGKEGLSPQFIAAVDHSLKHNDLIKIKFDDFKEKKKQLAPELAEKSGSHLVTRVGNVAVLYREKETSPPAPQQA